MTLYLLLITFNVTILPSFAISSFLKVIETRKVGSTFVFHEYLALIKSNLCNAVVEDLHIIQSSNSLSRKGIPFLNCFQELLVWLTYRFSFSFVSPKIVRGLKR